MALANCKRCGRLYNKINNLVDACSSCSKEDDEKFFKVRDYLHEQRRATMYEVSDATGVEVSLIIRFIREGRITPVDNPNLTYACDSCGTQIQADRYCKPCKDKLQKGLNSTKEALKQPERTSKHDYFHKRER